MSDGNTTSPVKKQVRGRGKKPRFEKSIQIRANPEDVAKFKKIGGAAWFRMMLRNWGK